MKEVKNGTVYVKNGYWVFMAKLPGDDKRRMYTLKAPGATHGLREDRPRKMAEEAAMRIWETFAKKVRRREDCYILDALCDRYVEFAESYYKRADGTNTSEVYNIKLALRPLRRLFGRYVVAEMTHADMLKYREAVVKSGIARISVNRYLAIVKRMITWALDEALIPALVKAELTQVQPLKRGRSAAREMPPVREIDDITLQKTMEVMMPNVADMVRVHRYTGMRPNELCELNWEDIDTTQIPWIYRPKQHKNNWRGEYGIPRVILIGPKARAILEKYKEYTIPFSPKVAVSEWLKEKREKAVSPSRYDRSDPHAQRVPGEKWNTASYYNSVRHSCKRANIPVWGVNRIRHAFATEVRRKFGYDACRAVLGHTIGARITDRYSFAAIEDEIIAAAREAVESLG